MEVCGLQMHPTKTQIVYCKDNRRRRTYPNVKFDFLGYQFRPRRVATHRAGVLLWIYPGGQSDSSEVHASNDPELAHSRQTSGTLAEIAQQINPLLRGGSVITAGSAVQRCFLWSTTQSEAKAWIMRKYKRFRFHKTRASLFLRKLARDNAELFIHWQAFGTTTFT